MAGVPESETRKHRTPEQVVLDLEAKIAAVKARAASRQAKANPAGKALVLAVKAIDKALGVGRRDEERRAGARPGGLPRAVVGADRDARDQAAGSEGAEGRAEEEDRGRVGVARRTRTLGR